MKFRTNDSEQVVLSITYKNKNQDNEVTSASVSIPLGDRFNIEGEDPETFAISNDESYINIKIPVDFNSKTTDGNILDEDAFSYTDIVTITVSLNYYITINGVTTSQSLSIPVTVD